jgi:hypothetical protein
MKAKPLRIGTFIPHAFPTDLIDLYLPPIRKDTDVIDAEILFTMIFVKRLVLIGIIIDIPSLPTNTTK